MGRNCDHLVHQGLQVNFTLTISIAISLWFLTIRLRILLSLEGGRHSTTEHTKCKNEDESGCGLHVAGYDYCDERAMGRTCESEETHKLDISPSTSVMK